MIQFKIKINQNQSKVAARPPKIRVIRMIRKIRVPIAPSGTSYLPQGKSHPVRRVLLPQGKNPTHYRAFGGFLSHYNILYPIVTQRGSSGGPDSDGFLAGQQGVV